jgi:hypothetical protein
MWIIRSKFHSDQYITIHFLDPPMIFQHPPSTTPTAAPATSPPPARPAPSETTLKMAHQDAETSKLYCHQYSSPGITSSQQVQFFLDKNIVRLPFSVDPFLGLSPFAHHLLYDHHNKAPLKPTPTYLSRPTQQLKEPLPLTLPLSYPPTSLALQTNTSKP